MFVVQLAVLRKTIYHLAITGDCNVHLPHWVGLCEWPENKILSIYPMLRNKNILRTFEAKILKIIKSIQPRSQNY